MTRLPTGASRWQQLKRLLESAIELPPAEQQSYLDDACAGDPSLRREVDSLLVHADAEDFLEYGVARAAAEALDLIETVNLAGEHLGPWKIEKRIGEGGMGAVYLAERADGEFTKQVAIKVVRQRAASDGVLRRFRAERQILADIEHPNIARLIDAGSTAAGLPYLVMEYVEGEPIDEYCDNQRFTIEKRLQLFRQVCAAVQLAHEHHVVHRDLKPSNVLITKDGTPKLLDFGIAKVLAPELLGRSVEVTAEFQRLMTPAFASPEQIRGETVTTASDVYSLGVILYALVCGHSPYDGCTETSASTEEIVCDLEPPAPSRALRQFAHTVGPNGESIALTPEAVSTARGTNPDALVALLEAGLDATVLKALAKQPSARYASAAGLGDAIEAYVRHGVAPPLATPASSDAVPTPGSPGSGVADARGVTQPPATLFEWGHLQVLRKVGEGMFGEVYEARDPSLDTTVALKLFRSRGEGNANISSEVARRILREGQMLAKVRHPNVLTVHGVGVHDETVGLWMEYIDGKNLEQVLEAQGRFGAREACLVGIDLCSALAAVHGQGVVHRDIKAQNVIREEGGRIVLTDFGSGRDLVGEAPLRGAGAVGTPLYMAPEVLLGGLATARSDIYGLGVLLFRLVTGTFPVDVESWRELIEKHERGETRLVRDLRADLQPQAPRFVRALEKALNPDPDKRFASVGQFQQALETSIDSTADPGAYVTPLPVAPEWEKKRAEVSSRLWTWGGAAAIALVSFTFLGLMTLLVERQSMRVPRGFATEGVLDFLTIGIRASVAAVVVWIPSNAVFIAAIFGFARLTHRLIGRKVSKDGLLRRLHDAVPRIQQSLLSADPAVVAASILLIGLLANLAVLLVNGDLWETIGFLSDEQMIYQADLTLLGDISAQYFYEWSFGLLFVVLSIAAAFMIGAARRQDESRPFVGFMHAGVIATIALAAVLLVMPWKLLVSEHDYTVFAANRESEEFWSRPENADQRWREVDGQTVDLAGHRAFIIAQTEGYRWLYFPELRYRTRIEERFVEPLGQAEIFVVDEEAPPEE